VQYNETGGGNNTQIGSYSESIRIYKVQEIIRGAFMKNLRVLSVILIVILIGVYSQFESMAQDQLTKIQQDNLNFYQQREMAASQEIKVKLQSMRELIKAKKYSFEVGYTTAMGYSIEQITGLVEPPDLNEQIMKQNEKAKQLMQMQVESVTLGTCSASASSFDWRKDNGTTSVRDQENCGSCWAFATCGAYEGNYRIINSLAIDCSEQQILDCNPWGYDCYGGWWAFQYFIDHGVTKESDYPYTATKGTCNTSVTVPYKALSWGYVGSSTGVPSSTFIKQALCQYGPLAVGVYATALFQVYQSNVFNETVNAWAASTNYNLYESVRPANNRVYFCTQSGTTGPTEPIWPLPTSNNPQPTVNDGTVTWQYWGGGAVNHGVTLIGWDDSKNAWLIKNSWGTGWGDTCGYGSERGYMWITYTSDNIGYAAAWVQAVKKNGGCCQ
jgi:C1A family cysteine protease